MYRMDVENVKQQIAVEQLKAHIGILKQLIY